MKEGRKIQKPLVLALIVMFYLFTNTAGVQNNRLDDSLTSQQQSIITIASLTAKGDLDNLENALANGLDNGLTVNQIKEVLVHLYAYCGFPRSIRGLQAFIEVLDQRKAKGITDNQGAEASPIIDERSKYDRGKEILEELVKTSLDGPKKGYAQFSPEIEVFLKEHLFADIFERDVLNYQQREMVTVSVLISIGGVEPMLRSHMNICLLQGITAHQLEHLIDVVATHVDDEKIKAAREVLRELTGNTALPIKNSEQTQQIEMMVRLAEVEIYPEFVDQYKAILKEEAARSVQVEPGVIAIFPMVQKENPTQFKILEIYADTLSYKLHLQTPHFKKYKSSTLQMVKSLELIEMRSVDEKAMQAIFQKIKR